MPFSPMTTHSPLTFHVSCSVCYGTEVWHRERIVHALVDAGALSTTTDADVEQLAELFIAHLDQIHCAACGKASVLTARRVKSGKARTR